MCRSKIHIFSLLLYCISSILRGRTGLPIIIFQERMSHTILFISHNCINIYILYALENVALYKRIHLFQVTDQFLDFYTFGAIFVIAGSAGICKFCLLYTSDAADE